jgi:hypothetical protein
VYRSSLPGWLEGAETGWDRGTGVLADGEHPLGKRGDGEAVSRVTQRGAWALVERAGPAAANVALVERGEQDRGREGTLNRCS